MKATKVNNEKLHKYYIDRYKNKRIINTRIENSITNIFSKSLFVKNIIFSLYISRNKKLLKNIKNHFNYNLSFTLKYRNFILSYRYVEKYLESINKNNYNFDTKKLFLKTLNKKSQMHINNNIYTKELEFFLVNTK